MSETGGRWKVLALFFAIVVSLMSFAPKEEMQSAAPERFLQAAAGQPGGDALARAYWERARALRWHYAVGHELPETPPPDFIITDAGPQASPQAAHVQRLYWQRLRTVWLDPDVWRKSYQFDIGWLTSLAESSWNYARKLFG